MFQSFQGNFMHLPFSKFLINLKKFENVGDHDGDTAEGSSNDPGHRLTGLISWQTMTAPVHIATTLIFLFLLDNNNKIQTMETKTPRQN